MADIIAILKCYAPRNGEVVANVILRSSGVIETHGDESLALHARRQLAMAAAKIESKAPPIPEPFKRLKVRR